MKIVICDDEKSTGAELENMIEHFMKKEKVRCRVDVTFSGEELFQYMEHHEDIDILFLDIELPGINGVDIGSAIRERMENEKIFIIYISSYEQYALALFQNRPFDFIVKPIEEKRILQVLEKCMRVMKRQDGYFCYQREGMTVRTAFKDILYFQSGGRKIDIVTVCGRENFYGRLNFIEKQISEKQFLRIHKSYLINYDFMKNHTYEEITMINGDRLSVSKAYRAEVRRKLLERRRGE